MKNRIEICLKRADQQDVSLSKLNPKALESFILVMNSFKSMIFGISCDDSLIFSIEEGSARCAVESSTTEIDHIFNEIDLAIAGESLNKDVTSNLRYIQEELSKTDFLYQFQCLRENKPVVDIHEILDESKQIRLKRRKKRYNLKIQVIRGYLNQVGGNEPNYHFDYGHGNKKTINCSEVQALSIKDHLYKNIDVIVYCKEWEDDRKDEYEHIMILDSDSSYFYRNFFNEYFKISDIIQRLDKIYDFLSIFPEVENPSVLEFLNILLLTFNNEDFDINELKTLLIISKPYSNNDLISETRINLASTYEKKFLNGSLTF